MQCEALSIVPSTKQRVVTKNAISRKLPKRFPSRSIVRANEVFLTFFRPVKERLMSLPSNRSVRLQGERTERKRNLDSDADAARREPF